MSIKLEIDLFDSWVVFIIQFHPLEGPNIYSNATEWTNEQTTDRPTYVEVFKFNAVEFYFSMQPKYSGINVLEEIRYGFRDKIWF